MIDLKFTTVTTAGVPVTLAGSPAISVYKANGTTQSTTGVTLTVDFDGVTGLHHVRIDTSADGTFYAAAADFQVVITTGTVSAASVVGYVIGAFSLSNRLVDSAGVATVLARLGAFTGTGLNTVMGYLEALMRKDAALTPSDVGGSFDNTTDSLESIVDNQPFIVV
jgi:hypothetical protein